MAPGFGYGAAVDAGSSGSRVHLYRWPRGNDDIARVEREAVFRDERTPGVDDDRGLGLAGLEELVRLAEAALPADVDAGSVPIHLGATAGMRIRDAEHEAAIMAGVRSLLRASEFAFRDDWARTISGEEEGAYDWLAANYLKNGGALPTSATAYGALDLGGASTQISFPVKISAEDTLPLQIDNAEYPMYSRSFLYYGVDQARTQYDAMFASAAKGNPCYPTGYVDADSGVSGSSDWEECLRSVGSFFEQTPSCNGLEKKCLTGDVHKPLNNGRRRFIAISAFVYIWDYLNLNIGNRTDDLATLDLKARQICNWNRQKQLARYERQMEDHPHHRKTIKPFAQCFNAAFAYHLLSRGYGMPTKRTPIEIYHDIDGTRVQWTLGMMMVEVNRHGSVFRENGWLRELYIFGTTYRYLYVIPVVVLAVLALWVPAGGSQRRRGLNQREVRATPNPQKLRWVVRKRASPVHNFGLPLQRTECSGTDCCL